MLFQETFPFLNNNLILILLIAPVLIFFRKDLYFGGLLYFKHGWKGRIYHYLYKRINKNKHKSNYDPHFILVKYFSEVQYYKDVKKEEEAILNNAKQFWCDVFVSYTNDFIRSLETYRKPDVVNYYEKLLYSPKTNEKSQKVIAVENDTQEVESIRQELLKISNKTVQMRACAYLIAAGMLKELSLMNQTSRAYSYGVWLKNDPQYFPKGTRHFRDPDHIDIGSGESKNSVESNLMVLIDIFKALNIERVYKMIKEDIETLNMK